MSHYFLSEDVYNISHSVTKSPVQLLSQNAPESKSRQRRDDHDEVRLQGPGVAELGDGDDRLHLFVVVVVDVDQVSVFPRIPVWIRGAPPVEGDRVQPDIGSA